MTLRQGEKKDDLVCPFHNDHEVKINTLEKRQLWILLLVGLNVLLKVLEIPSAFKYVVGG